MKSFAKSAPPASQKPNAGTAAKKEKHGLFNSVIVKWNLLYAFFLLIALLGFYLFSTRCITIITENQRAANSTVLETVRMRMDDFMTDLTSLGNTLSLNENVQNVMAAANRKEISRYYLSKLMNDFTRYEFLHKSGGECFLYFPYMDTAITTKSYGDAEMIYRKYDDIAQTNYDAFTQAITQEYAGTRFLSLETPTGENLLLAVRTVHTLAYYAHYCNVVTIIETEDLLSMAYDKDAGALFFCDGYNERVVSPRAGDWSALLESKGKMNELNGSFPLQIDGKNSIVTYCQSKTSTLIYGIASSEDAYFGDIRALSRVFGAAVVLYLLVSAGLVLFSAWQNYRWIHSIADYVSRPQDAAPGDREYQSIVSPISNLIDQNKQMKTRAAKQQLAIQHSLLQQLLNTTDPMRMPQRLLLESCEIRFAEGCYAIAAFSIDRPRSYLRDLICAAGKRAFEAHGLTAYPLMENTTVLFVLNGAMERERFDAELRSAVADTKHGITRGAVQPFYLAVSDTVPSWKKLSTAYSNVLHVLDYRDAHGQRVEYFADMAATPAQALPQYNDETDASLYAAVAAGDGAEAERLIKAALTENEQRLLSESSILFLTGNLLNTLCRAGKSALKTAWNPPDEATVAAIFAERDLQRLGGALCSLAEGICREVQLNRAKHRELKNMSTYLTAENFVLQNFQDSSLSVNSIAEELGLNVSTLSKLFKEEGGDNLSAYISRVRVAEAKKCLQRNMPLGDIVEHCGFGSQRTFLRVFKQYVGMTPTQYKNTSDADTAPSEESKEKNEDGANI